MPTVNVEYQDFSKFLLDFVIDCINFLPAEQPSEELEKEIESYLVTNRQYAGGDEEELWGDDCIRDAIKHGTQWQKEQMMKNCLYDTEVMMHTKLQNTEYLILANGILPHIPVSFGLNVGDKVKILIVKEGEK